MQITVIGYIAFLITFISFLEQKSVILLYSAIFFSGFSGSSVINIGDISIQPPFYFILIYLPIFFFSSIIGKKKIRLDGYYLLFIVYCSISILFSILLQSEEIIIMKQDGEYGVSSFSISHIIHIFYLLLGFLLFTILSQKGTISFKNTYKYYRYGVFAVIYICLYQLVAFRFNLPFDVIFRQGTHGNIQGSRLYGPCDEASMLCYYLAPSLLLLWLNRKNIFDIINILLGIFIGFYSYSSTFLIGIVGIVVFIKHIVNNKIISYNALIALSIGVFIIAIVIAKNTSMMNVVFDMFSKKIHAQNKSGTERITSFMDMAPIGFLYPFGIGFGSSRSKDLLSTWLCNIGIVGMLLFVILQIHFLKESIKKKRLLDIIPYLLVVILMMISVPEPYNLFIYVLLYFGTAKQNIKKKEDNKEYVCNCERKEGLKNSNNSYVIN